jgi:dTDP-4-amino-4,6-dideoxygalactose transaminase
MNPSLPMVDLAAEYTALKDEIEPAVLNVLRSGHFIMGPQCGALEQEIAAHCGIKHAIACADGTDALLLALKAAGIGAGDEVITPSFTFAATAEAIVLAGATPVFVDIEPDTYNIDANLIEAAITPRTRALMPVHLYGRPAALDRLSALCARQKLKLIEDCAQSLGSRYQGKATGAWGDAGCVSFYPSKNLGAYGDAGMVLTNDDALAQRVKLLRNHGSAKTYHHDAIGWNSRLDEIQAAILRVKLKRLDEFNRRRRWAAARYCELLRDCDDITLPSDDGNCTYHQFTLRTPKRDALMQALKAQGIDSRIYYPIPLHQQPAFAQYAPRAPLPHSEATASEVFSLPMHPYLDEARIERICTAIKTAP